MSDECGITFDHDHDHENNLYVETWRVARKSHQCSECKESILPRQRYQRVVGKSDGLIWQVNLCESCHEILHEFATSSWTFGGEVWENFQEEWRWGEKVQKDIDAFWQMVQMGWNIEPREWFEAQAWDMGMTPLSMAAHHMWKRELKKLEPAALPADGCDERETALREALAKLANEAQALLSCSEWAIRDAVGNTNVNVLQLRIDEARAALSTPAREPQS